MPLHLSDEEMDLLLSLAAPIDRRQREQFLLEVTAELEARGQAGAVGIGSVHPGGAHGATAIFHPARIAQRVAALPQRLRAKFKAGTLRARPRLSVVERPGLFASASVGAITSPHESIDGRGRDAVGASSVPATLL
jgi:hypothetical protein